MKKVILVLFSLVFLSAGNLSADEESETRFIVTDNGLEMFHWDLDFVAQAKQSIEIAAPFLGGEIARTLLKALEERIKQVPNLQVFIVGAPILLEAEDWQIVEHMQKTYPANFHYEMTSTISKFVPEVTGIDLHIKMFVVDEKYFSCGGTNLDETQCAEGTWTPQKNMNKHSAISANLPAGMRDQDVVGRGPFAKQLRSAFFKQYSLWQHYNKTGFFEKDPEKFAKNKNYFPITEEPHVQRFDEELERQRTVGASQIKMIIGGPHQSPSAITKEYVRLINEAKEEIIIANLYFCPVDDVYNALMEAVNRGVKLTVLTNGISDYSPQYTKYFCWANRINYAPLLYGKKFSMWDSRYAANAELKKVRFFEYHVKEILLHKKMMVIDGRYSVVGSYNLGYRSDIGEYEMIVIFDAQEIASDLKKVHEKDLSYSIEISPKEISSWYFDPLKQALANIQRKFHGIF